MVQKELTPQEHMSKIAEDHGALMKRITDANRDYEERARNLGIAFDLDIDEDTLTITIGDTAEDTYTQGYEHLYLDVELETDRIVAITILQFRSVFLDTEAGKQLFSDGLVLPVLLRYGTMSFPPRREGTRIAATELRHLVPA